jgi:hypothetical protein
LGEGQEPRSASGEARGGGGLGPQAPCLIAASRRLGPSRITAPAASS